MNFYPQEIENWRQIDTLDVVRKAYRDAIEIIGGCLGDECAQLYYGPDDPVPRDEQGNV